MATRAPSLSAPLADGLQAWALTMPQWVTGLLFTPLVFLMARCFPLDRAAWARNAVVHTVGAVGLTPGGVGIYHALAAQRRLRQAEVQRAARPARPAVSDPAAHNAASEALPDRLLITTRTTLVPVPVDAIRWIEADDAYVKLHTADATHLHRARLKDLAAQLAPKGLLRIHRSTVIRLDALDRVETGSGGAYVAVLDDGMRRRVSQSYRADLLAALGAVEDAP